jgi:hypothetical protein
LEPYTERSIFIEKAVDYFFESKVGFERNMNSKSWTIIELRILNDEVENFQIAME